jgi:hypothetical protein
MLGHQIPTTFTHELLPLANSLRTNDYRLPKENTEPFSDSVAVLPPILIRHVIASQSVALPDRKRG